MRSSDTIRLGQLFGIRVGVSRWWFLVLFFVIYALNGYFGQILPDGTQAFVVAVLGALLFFATVVAHELGHALVARHQGMAIEGVDLWALGGFTRTRGETASPGAEFRMAAAGPAVNVLVIAICIGLGLAFGSFQHFLDVALLESGLRVNAPLVLLGWLALINSVLLVFNLLPAFPLDGGRIARAAVWALTGDPNRATRACARLGQVFGMLVMAGGLALAVRGYTTGGLWFLLIGLFLTQAARQASAQATVGALIRDVTVADIMDPDPLTVPTQTTLLDAEQHYFHDGGAAWLVVADDSTTSTTAEQRGWWSPTRTAATAGCCSRSASITSCARAAQRSPPATSASTPRPGGSTPRRRLRLPCAPTACVDSERSSRSTPTAFCEAC